MKKKKTQLLGIVLSAAMLATSVPAPVYAEPTDNVAEEEDSDAAAVQETTDEADAVADDATDDSTAADDATPEEADEQDTADEADAQAAEEGDNEVKVDGGYTISIPTINFQGANAAVAEQMAKDVEIDESDPAIQSLRKALEEVEIVGGEAGTESNESNISTADLYEADGQETTQKLTDEQIDTVVKQYQNYLNQWADNANVLGVQNPFFLDFNDDTDGLGILGEMLALDGKTVQDVRDGKVKYDDLTGTSHNYETVSVPATCGRDAFTEERCSDCGLIKDGTRVEKENTAHEHHYIKFHEVYYTKTDGVKNEADNYVCPECGACITEPVKSKYEQANSTYEKRKAIWDAAIKNEAEGHTYVPTDAKWSDDYSTVTFQNLTCESCADKIDKLDCLLSSDDNATNKANRDSINKTLDKAVTVDAKMVSHAGTCDEGVTAVYKAADKTEDGVKYLVSTEVKGEAGQHTYSDVKFNWDAAAIKDDDGNITGYKTDQKEGTSVTVDEVKCSVCGEVQKNVSVSVVKDTDAYKAPTCEEAGKDVYVATVTSTDDNTVLAKETKEVAIAKLGHKYGDPVWSDWEEKDGKWTTTATFTCANDATHVQTPEVKIDSETVEKATYTKEGKVVYTASVTSPDGKKVVNPTTKEVVVEKERLAAVENLKASSSVGKVKLTWSEVKDAEGYLIYGIRGGGNKYGYIGMTSKTSFVDVKALTSDYNYYWVFAYCKDENGKMYPGLTAHYVYGKAQKCAAVTDLKASSVKGGVKLTWTKSAGAEGYLVYGIHPGEKYGYIGMTTKGTTFTDKKASSTDWNFYWVFPYHTDSNGNKVVGGTPKYVYGKAK